MGAVETVNCSEHLAKAEWYTMLKLKACHGMQSLGAICIKPHCPAGFLSSAVICC